MDDLNEKLAGILNNPKSMEKVRLMAESLLGDERKEKSPPENDTSALSGLLSGEGMPSVDELQKIMGIMSRFKGAGNDYRITLLKALKPNLSPERARKVDTAIKILQFIEILPYLKESGILNF